MNDGYVPLEPDRDPIVLGPHDEPDRLSIQLYEHALARLGLRGADVLEV